MRSRRWADARTAQAYPLYCETQGPQCFDVQATGSLNPKILPRDFQPGCVASIDVGPLSAGDIVVPSFSQLHEQAYRFAFALECADGALVTLPPCPSGEQDKQRTSHARIRNCIDYFELAADSTAARLHCLLEGSPPQRFLLAANVRPAQLTSLHTRPNRVDAASNGAGPVFAPQISQQDAPAAVRHGVCSPTSLAMALGALGCTVDTSELRRDCHDIGSGLFGVWPQNLYAASRMGQIGAVETFSDWTEPLAILRAGIPIVASIRFEAGDLHGAPLPETSGHLVLVRGVDAREVLVNDPAATLAEGVERRYATDEFARAWFSHRGAAYVFTAPGTTSTS